jgi:hypothetical protein
MLLARDAPADRERALDLIAASVTTYRELGMEGWAEKGFGVGASANGLSGGAPLSPS